MKISRYLSKINLISCSVASVLYREGKEERRPKLEEGRSRGVSCRAALTKLCAAKRPFAPTRKGKSLYGGRYFPNFYTNDTNGHDIICYFGFLNFNFLGSQNF